MVIKTGYYEVLLVSVSKGKTENKNLSLKLEVKFDDERFRGDWTFNIYLDPKGGWVCSEGYINGGDVVDNGLYLLSEFVKGWGTVAINQKVYIAVANTDYLGMLNGSKIIMDWDIHLLDLSARKGVVESRCKIFSKIIDKTEKKG